MKNTACVADISWVELSDYFAKGCKVAILPTGSIEQHGPHLPFGSDTNFAYEFSKKVASATNEKAGKPLAVVYPPIPYGNGGHWAMGEVWIKPTTLVTLYAEMFEQLLKQGFQYVLVINGHGGNSSIIYNAINESQLNGVKPKVFYSFPWSMMWDSLGNVKETKTTGHACEMETSTSMYLFPDLVDMDKLPQVETEEPEFWSSDSPFAAVRNGSIEHLSGGGQVGAHPGFVGNPTKASREKGERLVTEWAENVVEFLLELDRQ